MFKNLVETVFQYLRNLNISDKRSNIQYTLWLFFLSLLGEANITSFAESYFRNHLKTTIVAVHFSFLDGKHLEWEQSTKSEIPGAIFGSNMLCVFPPHHKSLLEITVNRVSEFQGNLCCSLFNH